MELSQLKDPKIFKNVLDLKVLEKNGKIIILRRD